MAETTGSPKSKRLRDFIEAVNNSPELSRKVREALDGSTDPGPFVAVGKSAGYEFTVAEAREHFHTLFSKTQKPELTDEELERVAGGKGGGTILPEDNVNAFQSSVNMMKGLSLKKPPSWTGFQ